MSVQEDQEVLVQAQSCQELLLLSQPLSDQSGMPSAEPQAECSEDGQETCEEVSILSTTSISETLSEEGAE